MLSKLAQYQESPAQFENRIQPHGVSIVLYTKKLHFVSWNWCKENQFYSISIAVLQRFFIEKNINFIFNLCFAAITLVIVLAWFL